MQPDSPRLHACEGRKRKTGTFEAETFGLHPGIGKNMKKHVEFHKTQPKMKPADGSGQLVANLYFQSEENAGLLV